MPTKLQIFLWNPKLVNDFPKNGFHQLSLLKQIEEFQRACGKVLAYYKEKCRSSTSRCLFVAPDYLFSRSGVNGADYRETDADALAFEMGRYCAGLDDDILVVAGTVVFQPNNSAPQITLTSETGATTLLRGPDRTIRALILQKSGLFQYDKEHPAGQYYLQRKYTDHQLKFNTLKLYVEICQDHEMSSANDFRTAAFLNDIHLVLAAGQLPRANRVKTRQGGCFIQCELEPGKQVDSLVGQKTLTNQVGTLTAQRHQSGQIMSTIQDVAPNVVVGAQSATFDVMRCKHYTVDL
ncbi:hypothetical protein [Corallococcus sicarius]|uniref:Uncharacterized protein n=1 Tax=Corallococcus sicarius TaxID=2316726 RepID=A0A3A8N4I4_9BACT|nr:hypothetical protein [Corallococcus sicarius]RKH37181.1 hypothetical protein D7X12_30510 [Corallococcus sicarius]